MNGDRSPYSWLPAIGCLTIFTVLSFIVLMPLLLVDLMRSALERLHLGPGAALASVIGIFVGSIVNVPVYRIRREELQPINTTTLLGPLFWAPGWQRLRQDTVIAVNVGGCVIPLLLATWQTMHLFPAGGWPLAALAIVVLADIFTCYWLARPVPRIGILLPGFAAALVAIGTSWLLLRGVDVLPYRPPVAFVAGVLGPLVGADLLHLRDITRVPVGVLSIGGAGTFDGIVLSSFLATLLV
jgi:uncharacterized membrane protein